MLRISVHLIQKTPNCLSKAEFITLGTSIVMQFNALIEGTLDSATMESILKRKAGRGMTC